MDGFIPPRILSTEPAAADDAREELTIIDIDGDWLEAKRTIFVNETHGDVCGVLLTKDAALALANWLQRAAEELP